jgi:serine protease
MSPSGTTPDGFNTSSGKFCAWHDWTGDSYVGAASPYGDIAFTNMPYVYDAGSGCGTGFVNFGTQGNLDGFSLAGGHEYAETLTDQNPSGGWTNTVSGSSYNGQENGDECSWIKTGQGASQNITMGTATFAMQSTWSNDTNRCDISHPIVTGSGTTTTTTASTSSTSSTSTSSSATTTSTTTTTTAVGACFNTSNYYHVYYGRAHDAYGYAYANGSNQYMGYDSLYYTTKLRQTGTNYYVVDNTCP